MAKNEVQVTITAKDNASGNLKKITGAIDGVSKSVLGINLTDIINPATMAAAALGTVAAVVKKGVADFAAYGEQVGDVSRKLGITAEESSKLIQVADDLEVDYSVLTQAMKEGLKDGIVPSIDGLSNLAVEYQKLKTPAEKAAFATDAFGRSGLEMQKILETAPEKLKEMGEAVELSGLLMDEKGVQAAKDYRLAVDGLGDSWSGLVARVMPGVVKGLTTVNNSLTSLITVEGLWAEASERGLTEEARRAVQFAKTYEEVGQILTDLIKGYDQALLDSVDTFGLANAVVGEQTDEQKLLAIALALTATEQNNVNTAVMTANDAMQTYSAALLYNKIAAGLDADAALSLATQMGLVDEKTVIATERLNAITAAFDTNKDGVVTANEDLKGYLATVAALNAQVLALPEDSYITIHVRTEGMDAVAALANITNSQGQVVAEARAGGGPVQPGGRYVVGENGPESLIMGAAGGQVYPTTNNYNLTIHSQARSEQVQASFAMMRALAR